MSSESIPDRIIKNNLAELKRFAEAHNYKLIKDIRKIPVNTQFYEVNLANNMISREKERPNDNYVYTLSRVPHFMITNDKLDSYSIVDWVFNSASKRSSSSKLGGNRTRNRKSSKKRITTKRR